MLKKNYFKTARELLQICVDHDNYLNHQDSEVDDQGPASKNTAHKLAKKLKKVRFEKLGLGALMRIVRSKHYENLTDDLTEVHLLRKKVPGMKRYIGILEKKRD